MTKDPVVTSDGVAIGVVSEADLLVKQENDGRDESHGLFVGKQARRRGRKAVAILAKDLMSAHVSTPSRRTSL